MTEVELRSLLPRDKCDCERAQEIIARGYPVVAPILRELLKWLQDCNWPVSHLIAPFLVSVGDPIVPLILEVFRSDDDVWKYWCIDRLVTKFPKHLAEQFRTELQRLAFHASNHEQREDLHLLAIDALEWLDGDG